MGHTKIICVVLVASLVALDVVSGGQLGGGGGGYPRGGPQGGFGGGGGRPSGSYNSPSGGGGFGGGRPSSSYGAPGGGSGGGYGGGNGGGGGKPEPYNFQYAVKDPQSGNDYRQQESSDGYTVRGEYSVLLPDGRTQIVKYTADDVNGYVADVQYQGEARPGGGGNYNGGGGNYNGGGGGNYNGGGGGNYNGGGGGGNYQGSNSYLPPNYKK